MMQSVFDLATVDPHEPAGRSIPAADWTAYRDGYYRALQMAMQVMNLAAVRFDLYQRERRRRRALDAAAAAELLVGGHTHVGDGHAVSGGDPAQELAQRRELRDRQRQSDRLIPAGVRAGEAVDIGVTFTVNAPVDARGRDEFSHCETYRIEPRKSKRPREGEGIVSQAGPPAVVSAKIGRAHV